MNEYLTLEEFKALRRISDTASDVELQRRITRASRAIDDRTGRRFWLDATATQRTFDALGGGLVVDDIGSLADLAVTVNGAAVTDYETWPRNALAKYRPIEWLSRHSFLGGVTALVTARWGWPAIPDSVTEATFLLANRRWKRKDSPEGVAGQGGEGAVRVSRFDPDIEDLIGPFVIDGFA